ncbi:MAG TPA: hypothetical protein VJP84_04220 [Steroidobacteraceae bacterium]|nr:hypothetical protein [Steroidobacteraceae bacterium]
MGIPSAAQLVLLLFLGGAFVHFMVAGGRTFSYGKEACSGTPRATTSAASRPARSRRTMPSTERTGMFLPRFSRSAPGR